MESVAIDQCQVLQLDRRKIRRSYYERGHAEMDADFGSYESHCREMRDDEHVR